MVYYNEFDEGKAKALSALMKANVIAKGIIDTRSIKEVEPSDLDGFTQCHFFAGIGVWSYALRCAGWRDEMSVWTGSCPCQPFSISGYKLGTSDHRHLWPDFFNLIQRKRPVVIFGEQVSSSGGMAWLDALHADLETASYEVGALDLCAAGVGAPHVRQRIFWVADSSCERLHGFKTNAARPNVRLAGKDGLFGLTGGFWSNAEWIPSGDGRQYPIEPGTFPVAYGPAARVLRLHSYGDAIVAPLAEAFIRGYMETRGLYAA